MSHLKRIFTSKKPHKTHHVYSVALQGMASRVEDNSVRALFAVATSVSSWPGRRSMLEAHLCIAA